MALLPWRVAVTRDETSDGPLSRALTALGLVPLACPVLTEEPPADAAGLVAAARDLEHVDWVVVASARAVEALSRARGRAWPSQLRTAAVGAATGRALRAAGVERSPLLADGDGARALWEAMRDAAPWPGARVLVPTTPGGRTSLAERLQEAGATVTSVEAYRMVARPPEAIAADWASGNPQAVVVASPRTAETLAAAVGAATLRALPVVAIGVATAEALDGLGVPSTRPPRADFLDVARLLADYRALGTSA